MILSGQKKLNITSNAHFTSLFIVSRETFYLKIGILIWQSYRFFSMYSEIIFS